VIHNIQAYKFFVINQTIRKQEKHMSQFNVHVIQNLHVVYASNMLNVINALLWVQKVKNYAFQI